MNPSRASYFLGLGSIAIVNAAGSSESTKNGLRGLAANTYTTVVINKDQQCYEVHELLANACGGHLASLHSQQDGINIKALYVKHGGMRGIKHHSVYLGGEYDGSLGQWSWTDDTVFDYENWREDPSDIVSSSGSWATRGVCSSTDDCSMSALNTGFVLPGAYSLPSDYADKSIYPNCDATNFLS